MTDRDFKGEDKFARFTMRLGTHEDSCDVCGRQCTVRLRYDYQTLLLPSGIKAEDTILKNPSRMWIGVTCGCYARFHRQVAHIMTEIDRYGR